MGYTLGCDLLKELDPSIDICKPDIHVSNCIKEFTGHKTNKIKELVKEFSQIVHNINSSIPGLKLTNYAFDKMIYLICSENFYLDDNKKNRTDKHRNDYLNYLRKLGILAQIGAFIVFKKSQLDLDK